MSINFVSSTASTLYGTLSSLGAGTLTGAALGSLALLTGAYVAQTYLRGSQAVEEVPVPIQERRVRTIHELAGQGTQAELREALGQHPDLANHPNAHGRPPLSYATNAENATVLLEFGAQINGRDHRDATPLHHAASREAPEVVEALLRNGAQVNAADIDGLTPLMTLARRLMTTGETIQKIQLLIQNGADVHGALRYFTTEAQNAQDQFNADLVGWDPARNITDAIARLEQPERGIIEARLAQLDANMA